MCLMPVCLMTDMQIGQGLAVPGEPSFLYRTIRIRWAFDQSGSFERAEISACKYIESGFPTALAALA